MALDTTKIKQVQLKEDQYKKEDCTSLKKQLVIHHTAGGANAENVILGWGMNSEDVATAFVIAGKPSATSTYKDGDIFQAFGSKYWAYHLAFSKSTNKVPVAYHDFKHETKIAKASIGIEVCNWGGLTKDANGVYWNYLNKPFPASEVIELTTPFRGFTYYHAYTDAQIAALKELILYLCDKFNIPKTYNADMWDINLRALNGDAGIFTHVSYRSDKCDMSPQPKLIEMLKSL